jgi:cholesterol transport system auxiliary component
MSEVSRRGLLAGLGGTVLLLGGCEILPQVGTPTDLYTLTPKTSFDKSLPKVGWQLIVELPVAAAGLDTTRIALQHTPYTLEYYARAAWTDNAPAMVQTLIIESFESTGSILAVGREAIGLRPDFILKTDLREFQAAYYDGEAVTAAPTIFVRMNAKLVQMPERRIVTSNTFDQRVPAASDSFKHIIEAFDDALGSVIKRIVISTLSFQPDA